MPLQIETGSVGKCFKKRGRRLAICSCGTIHLPVPRHPPTYSVNRSFAGCLERCGTLTLNVPSARAPSQAKDLTDWCAMHLQYQDSYTWLVSTIIVANQVAQRPSSRGTTEYSVSYLTIFAVASRSSLLIKKACHIEVATLLRARTMGNSPSALRNNIAELHSQAYLHKVQTFLALAQKEKRLWPSREFSAPPDFEGVPTLYWFLAIYVRDIMTRCKKLKCSLASTYGRILKIDSTKKVIKNSLAMPVTTLPG